MQLVGLRGIHATQSIPLAGAELTLGRDSGNTIVCSGDSSVSRRHARIIVSGSTGQIEDLGSSNGTYVNGNRITSPTALNQGDEIAIGSQAFRFEAEAPQTFASPIQGATTPKEVSRGEPSRTGWVRPAESSRVPNTDYLRGCAVPQLNLPDSSGCLRLLIFLLLALAIVVLLGGLLMLGGMGLAAIGNGLGHHGPANSSTGGGGAPPSNGGSTGGGAQEEHGEPGIRIREVRVEATWHSNLNRAAPRILVTWDNVGDKPVRRIVATVTTEDASHNPIVTTKNVVIYDGKAVETGGSHRDTAEAGDGFDPPAGGNPSGARVEVTSWE